MGISEIKAIVCGNDAQTVIAFAFRRALNIAGHQGRGTIYARADRYRGASRLMRQRYGVRM